MENNDPSNRETSSEAPTISIGIPTTGPHPTQVDRYRILEPIAEGGMGTVYKAEQREPVVRTVALKVIKLGMDSVAVISRFNAERQALAMMDHPNIAKVLDAGTTEQGRPYFVMEYVPGEAITAYCDRHRLTTAQRLQLFIPVCEAVQHAHQKGIIHRDLKPSNIMVTLLDGVAIPKVIDFGVAKATAHKLTQETLFTEAGQLIGTPEYMSPEQAEKTGIDVDTRSDVYSLGVVLYELLTGALPFDPKTLRQAGFAEIQRIIRDVDPPRPSTRFSSLSADDARLIAERRQIAVDALARNLRRELEWIPLKAMHKDRTRRYRTPTELADDLGRYLAGEPLVAAPDSAGYRLKKFVVRNRAPVAFVAVVLVLLLGGIVGTSIGMIGQAKQRAEAEKQREIAEAVLTFQGNMFASADPEKLLGDTVTVVQAMDGAVKELDQGQLKDKPLVEAAVRQTIGSTYAALGRAGDAEVQLRRSVQLRRQTAGSGEHNLWLSINDLALALQQQNKLTEAEPLFYESLDMARKATWAGKEHVATSESNVGGLLRSQNKPADAEPLFRDALSLYRQSLASTDPRIASAIENLADLQREQRKFEEAEKLLRESLEFRRRVLPAGHPDIGRALSNLGGLMTDSDRLVDAEPLFREALDMHRKALPALHPTIATDLNNLGNLLDQTGRQKEAETLYRESLDIKRKSLPADHPQLAISLNNLATLEYNIGNLDESQKLFREALEILRKSLPANHPHICMALANLAGVLQDSGRLGEAESVAREAVDLTAKSLPPKHPNVAISLQQLASILQAEEKNAEAEPLLRKANVIFAEALPPGHPRLIESMNTLAAAIHDQGRAAEGEALLRETLALCRAHLPADHAQLGATLSNLSASLDEQKRFAEAEPVQRELVQWRQKNLKPDDWRNASAAGVLGRYLLEQGKLDEAEPLLLDAAKTIAGNEHAPLIRQRESLASMVHLYEARKNSDAAIVWKTKLQEFDARHPTTQPK